MSLYKRPGSRFYWIRLERNGHVIQESTGKVRLTEAKLYEAQRRIEAWPELEGGKEIPTLSAFTRQLYPYWTRELKTNTRETYLGGFKALLTFPALADARLNEITPSLIEQYKTHRLAAPVAEGRQRGGATVSLTTLNHDLRALRRALNLAANVFEYKLTPPKMTLRKEHQRDYDLKETDFQRVLEACGRPAETVAPTVHIRQGAGRQTMQAILTVLYDCGLRASEASNLTWDRVSLEQSPEGTPEEEKIHPWLFINHGKTRAARRRVPLTTRVVTALSGLKDTAKVVWVFTRHGGNQPITTEWVSHEFTRVRRLLGLPNGCVLHSLRHSTATRLGNKGCSTGDLMKIMGWETAGIAARYTHLDDARMEQIVGFLEVGQ